MAQLTLTATKTYRYILQVQSRLRVVLSATVAPLTNFCGRRITKLAQRRAKSTSPREPHRQHQRSLMRRQMGESRL